MIYAVKSCTVEKRYCFCEKSGSSFNVLFSDCSFKLLDAVTYAGTLRGIDFVLLFRDQNSFFLGLNVRHRFPPFSYLLNYSITRKRIKQ